MFQTITVFYGILLFVTSIFGAFLVSLISNKLLKINLTFPGRSIWEKEVDYLRTSWNCTL